MAKVTTTNTNNDLKHIPYWHTTGILIASHYGRFASDPLPINKGWKSGIHFSTNVEGTELLCECSREGWWAKYSI